ncbi:MAG: hypothetical protein ACPG4T_02450 [Nannocystaceae bacterium]
MVAAPLVERAGLTERFEQMEGLESIVAVAPAKAVDLLSDAGLADSHLRLECPQSSLHLTPSLHLAPSLQGWQMGVPRIRFLHPQRDYQGCHLHLSPNLHQLRSNRSLQNWV